MTARAVTIGVKRLADENRENLRFVMRSALAFGIENQWLLVAVHQGHLLGFAHYRHRQDTQTTLYELCVQAQVRKQGIGKALVLAPRAQGKTCLVLKTAVDLPANGFYEHLGFVCREVQPGKKRALHVWEQSW